MSSAHSYTPKASLDLTSLPALPSQKPASPGGANGNTGFWSSLGKVLNHDKSGQESNARNDRSLSRGRDMASSGRGGAGNFVRSESQTRATVVRTEDGDERGRQIEAAATDKIIHAGRGGAGNVRSPSRDPKRDIEQLAFEEGVIQRSRETREALGGISSGRGGTGNISKSRSRSREPGIVSGRGGLGNVLDHVIHPRGDLEKLEEEERATAERQQTQNTVSHGRGGTGNFSAASANLPRGTVENTEVAGHSGRGGAGNVAH